MSKRYEKQKRKIIPTKFLNLFSLCMGLCLWITSSLLFLSFFALIRIFEVCCLIFFFFLAVENCHFDSDHNKLFLLSLLLLLIWHHQKTFIRVAVVVYMSLFWCPIWFCRCRFPHRRFFFFDDDDWTIESWINWRPLPSNTQQTHTHTPWRVLCLIHSFIQSWTRILVWKTIGIPNNTKKWNKLLLFVICFVRNPELFMV